MARVKKPAASVPQSREEFELAAVKLGELIRCSDRIASQAADAIARIKLDSKLATENLASEAKALWRGVSAYAEAHRGEMLPDGRKSLSIAAGILGWRIGRARIAIPKELEDDVIQQLDELDLGAFLRVTTEIDKAAILASPDKLPADLAHLVVPGVEELFFKPLDADSELIQRVRAKPEQEAA